MTEIGGTMSHYKILEKLGEGGMGVVYRAEDANLGRQVAVKVLPDIFSGDPERMARFEREARLLASLNHPNIATIHGLEQAEGKRFLAMELVEGETLAQRLLKGPLPIEEALEVCRQIAEGVEAAHEKGVIHRDLKPANIKITPEGKVKILDFGLAKAFTGELPAASLSQSPTLTGAATHMGVILGTASYMSPEQARGKPVDKRTDIWAFGCVLYEALSGRKAFDGDTVTDIIGAIVKIEPNHENLPAECPGGIRKLVLRCLQKDPNQRLRDIGDARIEIMEAINSPANEQPFRAAVSGDPDSSRRRQAFIIRFLLGILAVTIFALSVAIWRWPGRTSSDPAGREVNRFYLETPPEKKLWAQGDELALALSRDGRHLVYIGSGKGRQVQMYVRSMHDLTIRSIPETLGMEGSSLCVSPDGQWASYYKNQKLWKIRIEGGSPVPLCDSPARIYHADWAEDNTIIFAAGSISGLYRIPDRGGEAKPLTNLDKDRREVYHSHPQMLPGAKVLLFTVSFGNYDTKNLEVLSLESGKRKTIFKNVYRAQYVTSGHLVFARGETLFAVPVDLDRLETYGQEESLVADVQVDLMFHRVSLFTVSDSGDLVYVPGGQGMGENELVWSSQREEIKRLDIPAGLYHSPRISADGRRLAVTEYGQSNSNQVYLYDLSRLVPQPIIASGSDNRFSIWRPPDDKHLAFGSNRDGLTNMFLMATDGRGEPELLQKSEMIQEPWSWSPDGKLLAYVETTVAEDLDILVLSIDRDKKTARPFLATARNEAFPRFSPKDGRWIAYVTDESGQGEVWIAEYNPESGGAGRKEKVSRNGGWEPVWSRDGNNLFYRNLDGTNLMAVDIQTQPELKVGDPHSLFPEPDMPSPDWIAARGSYDVAPDGRFLMISGRKSRQAPIKMVLVQNWLEELKQKVPTGK